MSIKMMKAAIRECCAAAYDEGRCVVRLVTYRDGGWEVLLMRSSKDTDDPVAMHYAFRTKDNYIEHVREMDPHKTSADTIVRNLIPGEFA